MTGRHTPIRWLIGIVLLGAVVAFFALGLQHQLSLKILKARQQGLDAWHQAHSLLLAAGFLLL